VSIAAGCSSSEGSTSSDGGAGSDGNANADASPGTDASASQDGASSQPDSGADTSAPGACNMLGVPANAPEEAIASDAPAATGGTVADGTYDLVKVISYTGAGGQTGTSTTQMGERYEIRSNTWQLATSVQGTLGHFTQTVTYSGTNVTPTTTCGSALDAALPYSVDGSKLTLYAFGGRVALVFQKS
jgi:hypothetical protein